MAVCAFLASIDRIIVECLCMDRTPHDMQETADLIYHADAVRRAGEEEVGFTSLEKRASELLAKRRTKYLVASPPAS